jgi:precorrin-6Y C5,15-methyltransferase (decarboxylating) CbiT subunit
MPYFPGIADEQFVRGDIPMTKQEIRVLALAKAQIGPSDVVVDIGAGTGSLSLEAALQAKQGKVIAIEREEEGIELIKANAGKFGVNNMEIIHGFAPDALQGISRADVIFVGGSGGQLEAILSKADEVLNPGGRLIIMAVTVETLSTALKWAEKQSGFTVTACGVQINRIRVAGPVHMFQALNQVYIITCAKQSRG